MMIYLGADHAGFNLKEKIKGWLLKMGLEYEDLGNQALEPTDDYPLYVLAVAQKVAHDPSSLGIIIGRSGNGEAITANKVRGIRAALCLNARMAQKAREDNHSNILSLGADFTKEDEAQKTVETFIQTRFSRQKKHLRRIKQIENFEEATLEVIPGILEKEPEAIRKKINLIQDDVDWIHIDVADGTLVNEKTFTDFSSFPLKTKVHLEAHLMVKDPSQYLTLLTKSGFTRLIAHVEASNLEHFFNRAQKIKPKPEIGLAIDLGTQTERILPFLERIDLALIMSVTAGRSGQTFRVEALKKIVAIRELKPNLPVSVDGGVNNIFAPVIAAAGASRVVSNSYIFKSHSFKEAIESLKKW